MVHKSVICLVLLAVFASDVYAIRFRRYTDGSQPGFNDDVAYSTRAYWMRRALAVQTSTQGTNCPFGAFGAVIVNRTDNTLFCTNSGQRTAPRDPALHAENEAMRNCTAKLAAMGIERPGQAYNIWNQLDLYATGEPCAMDCGAALWSRFNTVVWAVSIDTLSNAGFLQIEMPCDKTFDEPNYPTRWIGRFLEDEIAPYFSWQYDPDYPCPTGCQRVVGATGSTCSKI